MRLSHRWLSAGVQFAERFPTRDRQGRAGVFLLRQFLREEARATDVSGRLRVEATYRHTGREAGPESRRVSEDAETAGLPLSAKEPVFSV